MKQNYVPYNVSDLPLYIQIDHLSNHNEKKTAPHYDLDMETVYVRSGKMNVIVNGETIPLDEGEVCVIDSGCLHYYTSVDDQDCTFYTGLSNEKLFSGAGSLTEKYISPIFHSFHPNYAVVRKDNPYSPKITNLFKEMKRILDEQENAYELDIVAKLHEYIALLFKALPSDFFLTLPVLSEEADSFQKMVYFIYRNYGQKISIEDIAKQGNISRGTCYKMFEKYTEKTPMDFVMNYRLTRAKTMLEDPSIPILDIAMNCGFAHQSHFTNHYHKHFGISPKKYRMDYLSNASK